MFYSLKKKYPLLLIILIIGASIMSCANISKEMYVPVNESKEIHVFENGSDETGDGSIEKPYATPAYAAGKVSPGTTVIVHEGTYPQFEIGAEASGTEAWPVAFKAAEGEKVLIDSVSGEEAIAGQSVGIYLTNVDNITLEGFEVRGGTHGIYYESLQSRGEKPLMNIHIKDCTVHGVRGTHGICVYARNDYAPVKNITMSGCHVYDCECFDSESTVFNGNIDGFTIEGNLIHDNNNIGIDMIGFEGNAKHNRSDFTNPYDVDFVRNGECFGNVVYNISAEGNEAYLTDEGEYDLCADGIYVDGGQNIKIHDNFVFNCDIGIEVATEHSPDDNELFKVSGMDVYDNVVAHCEGWCGLCFGGYDKDLGFTQDSLFHNNTFVDNAVTIGVQRSLNNKIYDNIFIGEGEQIEYNTEVAKEDMVNEFSDNIMSETADGILKGFKSLTEGKGSAYTPAERYIKIYEEN